MMQYFGNQLISLLLKRHKCIVLLWIEVFFSYDLAWLCYILTQKDLLD